MEEDIKEATNEVHEVTQEEPTEEINEDLQYVQECQEITRSVGNKTNEKFVPEDYMNNPPQQAPIKAERLNQDNKIMDIQILQDSAGFKSMKRQIQLQMMELMF